MQLQLFFKLSANMKIENRFYCVIHLFVIERPLHTISLIMHSQFSNSLWQRIQNSNHNHCWRNCSNF